MTRAVNRRRISLQVSGIRPFGAELVGRVVGADDSEEGVGEHGEGDQRDQDA